MNQQEEIKGSGVQESKDILKKIKEILNKEWIRMGFAEILTLIFIILRLTNVIDWSWWLVLLPELIALSIYIIFYIVVIILISTRNKRLEREVMKKYNKAAKRTRNKQREYEERRKRQFENSKLEKHVESELDKHFKE